MVMHHVIRSFATAVMEDLFSGLDSRRARQACPSTPWDVVARTLTQRNRVRTLRALSVPPGNRSAELTGNRKGQHSRRINDQYRVCFRRKDGHADDVAISDYHEGVAR